LRRIKIAVSLIFVVGVIAALAGQSLGYPPLLAKAKKFGAKDCTFCHVDPEGGPPWNERGQWLIKEKERRKADTVDVEWLADYKPSATQAPKPAESAKPGDTAKPSAKAGKPDPKTFDDYVGEYEVPIGILVITHEGDKLFGQPKGESKEELQPQDDGTFKVTNVNAIVTFVRDDKGKVTDISVKLNGEELKGKKIK
jgi:Domain of unknown function (DUF3471)